MADKTKIEWTDATWTPIRARHVQIQNDGGGKERVGWHCEHVSEGCRNCYAENINNRLGTGVAFKPSALLRKEPVVGGGYNIRGDVKVILDEKILLAPLRWRKPRMIFVCSMTDLFGPWVPDEMIDRVFAVMAVAQQHSFQVLTKRSARMQRYLTDPDTLNRISAALGNMLDGDWIWTQGRSFRSSIEHLISAFLGSDIDDDGDVIHYADPIPLPNVWLGVSVEDQATRARLIDLAQTPAAIRFVSAEPLLEGLSLTDIPLNGGPDDHDTQWLFNALTGEQYFRGDDGFTYNGDGPEMGQLGWAICGGESGPGARPMHPDWARSLRDQCAAAGVPFLFKQWGTNLPGEMGSDEPSIVWQNGTTEFYHEHQDIKYGDHWLTKTEQLLTIAYPVGKRAAGRHLDGIEHNGFPQVLA